MILDSLAPGPVMIKAEEGAEARERSHTFGLVGLHIKGILSTVSFAILNWLT